MGGVKSHLRKRRRSDTFLEVPVWIQLRQVPVIHVLQRLLGGAAAAGSLLGRVGEEQLAVSGDGHTVWELVSVGLTHQRDGVSQALQLQSQHLRLAELSGKGQELLRAVPVLPLQAGLGRNLAPWVGLCRDTRPSDI